MLLSSCPALLHRCGSNHACMPCFARTDQPVMLCAQCGLINGIVGNVLTAPQVDAGQLSLQCAVFNPAVIVGNVLQACRFAARGSSIDWECMPEDSPLPELVEGDRDRIAQVVQNTITNVRVVARTRALPLPRAL
jgi:signal transduction histidine kinase